MFGEGLRARMGPESTGAGLDPRPVPELGRGGVTCRTKCSMYVCWERGIEQLLMFTSGARYDYI